MPPTAAELDVHRKALTGHCYRMLGSAADAEDAAFHERHARLVSRASSAGSASAGSASASASSDAPKPRPSTDAKPADAAETTAETETTDALDRLQRLCAEQLVASETVLGEVRAQNGELDGLADDVDASRADVDKLLAQTQGRAGAGRRGGQPRAV